MRRKSVRITTRPTAAAIHTKYQNKYAYTPYQFNAKISLYNHCIAGTISFGILNISITSTARKQTAQEPEGILLPL